MGRAAGDGLFFRNVGIPVYGVSGYFATPSDCSSIHGLNERIGIREFHEAVAMWYQLLKTLAR